MGENNSIETNIHTVNFSEREIGFLALQNKQILDIDKNIRKQKKIRDIKILKTNPLLLETTQCPIIKP